MIYTELGVSLKNEVNDKELITLTGIGVSPTL
jgi:hypothetical protein